VRLIVAYQGDMDRKQVGRELFLGERGREG
jgi:hypothetical protein